MPKTKVPKNIMIDPELEKAGVEFSKDKKTSFSKLVAGLLEKHLTRNGYRSATK